MWVNSVQQLVDAELAGKARKYMWRKFPNSTNQQWIWFDLAVAPWNPVPKYWFDSTPLVAKQVAQSTDWWLYHWPSTSPETKYLRTTTAMFTYAAGLPINMLLCDYLLYYPTIDDSTIDTQILDNTATLPRYTNGEGVNVIAVTTASRTWWQSFYFTYTNSKGVAWRTSQTVTQNNFPFFWQITTSSLSSIRQSGNPFIWLQSWDTGVRSIQSVTMLWADVWLFTLILVKPIAQTQIREATAPVEKDYLLETSDIPEIKDDAFLWWLINPQWAIGNQTFFWDLQIIYN